MYKTIISELEKTKTTLVAVSKTRSASEIKEIYDLGQRHFGENRVQELVAKKDELPSDIHWHLIGSLQTNKVKNIASFVGLIHSVDSLKLAEKINEEALKNNREIDILLQLKISQEHTKHGFEKRKLFEALKNGKLLKLSNVNICGLMGMASFSDNDVLLTSEFKNLKKQFLKIKEEFIPEEHFKILSMGMSGDYKLAIENGSTMVRIGSLVFGARD